MRVPVGCALALIISVLAIPTGACLASGTDHQLLDRFFAASRLRDRTALARLSTVVFEPLADGMVTGFDVQSSRSLDQEHREVIVNAVVAFSDGTERSQLLRVTLTRRDLAGLPSGAGPWVVTAFTHAN